MKLKSNYPLFLIISIVFLSGCISTKRLSLYDKIAYYDQDCKEAGNQRKFRMKNLKKVMSTEYVKKIKNLIIIESCSYEMANYDCIIYDLDTNLKMRFNIDNNFNSPIFRGMIDSLDIKRIAFIKTHSIQDLRESFYKYKYIDDLNTIYFVELKNEIIVENKCFLSFSIDRALNDIDY